MAASVQVDLRKLDKSFKAAVRAGMNMRPALAKMRKPLRKDQDQHMKDQTGPSGTPWKPLAASTRERMLNAGGRAGKHTKRGKLRKKHARKLSRLLSKRLLTGAKIRVDRDSIAIYPKRKIVKRISNAHQRGGVLHNGGRLPSRPFYWVSDPVIRQAVNIISAHIADAFNKGKAKT